MRPEREQGGTGEAPASKPVKKNYIRPLDIKHGRIDMGHGAGGKACSSRLSTTHFCVRATTARC